MALMPIAAPLRGLTRKTGTQWAEEFVNLLEEGGLLSGGSVLSPFLMMPPLENGGWGASPMCSAEATEWLRELLTGAGFGLDEVAARATHSFKATLLSWCAKFGISKPHRKILGYHLDSEDTTMAMYGRDNCAPAVRDLDRVTQSVRDGRFLPVQSRSGYFVPAEEQVKRAVRRCGVPPGVLDSLAPEAIMDDNFAGCVEIEVEQAALSTSESPRVSSSESSDAASLALEETFAELTKETVFQNKAASLVQGILEEGTGRLYHHRKHGTIHLRRSGQGALGCGRVLHKGFGRLLKVPAFDWPMCQICFAQELHESL